MLHIIKLMSKEGGSSLSEMSEATGIDRWSISDMIDNLEAMNPNGENLCISEHKDPSDKRRNILQIDKDKLWNLTIPALSLTEDEGILLALLLKQAQQTPALKDVAQSLETKLSWFKAPMAYKIYNVNATEKIVSEDAKKTVTIILKAIQQDKCLSFTYDNAGHSKLVNRKVMPLYMFAYDGGLYLNAQKLEDGELRTYALERMQSLPQIIKAKKKPAKLPYDGRLEDPFGPFCEVEPFTFSVTFDSWQGWYNMQKRWPKSITVEKKPDDTYTLTATTRGFHFVKKWILGQCEHVKKIEPDWLRNSILKDINVMQKAIQYK